MTASARAHAAVRRAVREHDENFPVAFLLLPREQREAMHAIYAFCRATDDLGDEGAPDRAARLARLDAWERDVHTAWGGAPDDPRLAALAIAVDRFELPLGPFLRLIEANRMDQRQDRWDTYEDLLRYCRHSATPVGEMVLAVLGYRDAWRIGLSDHTCIGLQLINFWQDIARDLADRGRVYLPREDMDRFGVDDGDLARPPASPAARELVAFEVDRARAHLREGGPLARLVPARARLDLRMFTAGGLALCDAVAEAGYDTVSGRPAPGALGRGRIAGGAAWGMIRGRA